MVFHCAVRREIKVVFYLTLLLSNGQASSHKKFTYKKKFENSSPKATEIVVYLRKTFEAICAISDFVAD